MVSQIQTAHDVLEFFGTVFLLSFSLLAIYCLLIDNKAMQSFALAHKVAAHIHANIV
jgi:hypothetical protein